VFLAVLALVVTTFGVASYRAVHESAVTRASERLASVARELSANSVRSSAPGLAALRSLARDPAIVQALAAGPVPVPAVAVAGDARVDEGLAIRDAGMLPAAESASLARLLQSRRRPADSTVMGWELWTADGMRRYGSAPLRARDSAVLAAAAAAALASNAVTRSALYGSGERAYLWAVAPVESNGRAVGILAERRRIVGSAQTETAIARLTGQDVHVYFASRGSPEWVSVRGQPIDALLPPTSIEPAVDSAAIRVANVPGGPLYLSVASLPGTPLRIVLTHPEASILARPRAFLRQIMLTGVLLIVAGTLAAWWLSRREVRPLVALRRAAESMAQGDYSRVVAADGAEESAALADAFNTMSARISRAHAALAEQNDALQRANEAKARFLAVMSHELRTPLNAIGGFADLMALGIQGPTTASQREGLGRIKRNQEQLLHLVSDILHYARLEATPLSVRHDPVPLQGQLVAMGESMAEQFARKAVSLQVRDTEAVLVADAVRVQQVLLNLVTNALQFTEPGGSVEVYAEPSQPFTAIHVRDTGSGIAPDQQETIFEPFVQADNTLTRRVGGTGLGLAIVRQLVAAMGGEVRVKSALGKGSTFTVMLPAADPERRARATPATSRQGADAGAPELAARPVISRITI
jgi:signal transduction histidine kinase